jgi:hypothetical protein
VVVARRRQPRKWRLRGRRGQVAAVATILGLLIVVVFVANYLTTTLPGQMAVNDLNHVIQVENQVGRFQALLLSTSAADAVGAEVTTPITLGSVGQPPFATADTGTIGPERNGSYFQVNSTLSGPLTYTPPTGGTAGGNHPAGCTIAATGAICTGTNHLQYNWSGSDVNYAFTTTAGTYLLNVTDSGASNVAQATITVSASGSNPLDLLVIGSNDTIAVTIPTTGTFVNLFVFGNYDTTSFTATGAGATEHVQLYEDGVHDADTTGGADGMTFIASIWGGTDSVAGPTTANANAGTNFHVYFSGFNPTGTACPVDNIATSDTVSGGSTTEGTYVANWNVTTSFTPTAVSGWTLSSAIVSPIAAACPFFAQSAIPFDLAQSSAGFDVHFLNTYMPSGDVAFDQGAVIYAQYGGVPLMIDGPSISATLAGTSFTTVSMWFPVFTGTLPTDSGLSTTSLAARLVSVNTIALTAATSLGIENTTNIVVTIHSPFAAAWANYFNSSGTFPGNWVCTPAGPACSGPYSANVPMGTVVLTIPAKAPLVALTIQVATYSVSLV